VPNNIAMPLDWRPVPAPGRVTLRGSYVTLEPLDAERHAADLWQALQGNNELWAWLSDGPYATEAALRRAIEEKQDAEGAVFLAIVPGATGTAAGFASFMRIDTANGVVEVGNILLGKALQRTTAASEALFLMAIHVFEHLGYRRLEWKCNAANEPSRRAAARLGFQFEGIFRQHMVVKGRNRDTAWYSMLDREWPARKTALEVWLAPDNFDNEGRQRQSLAEVASVQGWSTAAGA